ncbi:MAG: heparinase II/III domain-containing protein [Opitutales bacterium]
MPPPAPLPIVGASPVEWLAYVRTHPEAFPLLPAFLDHARLVGQSDLLVDDPASAVEIFLENDEGEPLLEQATPASPAERQRAVERARLREAAQVFGRQVPVLAAAWRLSGDDWFADALEATLAEMSRRLDAFAQRYPRSGLPGWTYVLQGLAQVEVYLARGPVPQGMERFAYRFFRKDMADAKLRLTSRAPEVWDSTDARALTGLLSGMIFFQEQSDTEVIRAAFQLLERFIDSLGPRGETGGGLTRERAIGGQLLEAVAIASTQDPDLWEKPVLREMVGWWLDHLMPGRHTVNYGDTPEASLWPRQSDSTTAALSLLAVYARSPTALWALRTQFDSTPTGLPHLVANGLMAFSPSPAPPPFGHSKAQPLVAWRDHWDPLSNGLWVKGGRLRDKREHADRGHLSLYSQGRPVLIEAGMPELSDPNLEKGFRPVRAHNTLQLDDLDPIRGNAPITVRRLDTDGGNIRVDNSANYLALAVAWRDVIWDAREVLVIDALKFNLGQRGDIHFYWHLGYEDPDIQIEQRDRRVVVETRHATFIFEANRPFTLGTTRYVDRTTNPFRTTWHTMLILKATDRAATYKFRTRIQLKERSFLAEH